MEGTTPARLRQELDAAERAIVVMHEAPDGAAEIVRRVERIETMLADLEARGVDVRAEGGRADALRARLLREAGRVVRMARDGPTAPEDDSPLWRAVVAQAESRARRLRRTALLAVGAVGALALLLFVVIPRLFPPAPTADVEAVAQRAAAGDVDAALALARAEGERVPTDASARLWIGALELRRGNRAAATVAWGEARPLFDDEIAFRAERGLVLLQAGALAAAEEDARALLELPGGASYGHFLLGQAHEIRGDARGAIAAFEEAARLAEEGGNPGLTVMARTRLASLMERLPFLPTPTP